MWRMYCHIRYFTLIRNPVAANTTRKIEFCLKLAFAKIGP